VRGVERWRVRPGAAHGLGDHDAASTEGAPGDRSATEAATAPLHDELFSWQDRLRAEATRSLLVVLQGLDASGKDGTIKHVFRGVNPQGTSVAAFKEPTPVELAHDFLWRVHRCVPGAGEITIFNRSHYEDVLVVRVHGLVPPEVWRGRYAQINHFERLLHDAGTTIVKCFLHISFDEQGRRLQARLDDPAKRWKAQAGDFTERRFWDAYQEAYAEALARTSTDVAPWYVVPADHKWYRNWVVSQILLHTMEAMDPRYPPALPDGVPPSAPG